MNLERANESLMGSSFADAWAFHIRFGMKFCSKRATPHSWYKGRGGALAPRRSKIMIKITIHWCQCPSQRTPAFLMIIDGRADILPTGILKSMTANLNPFSASHFLNGIPSPEFPPPLSHSIWCNRVAQNSDRIPILLNQMTPLGGPFVSHPSCSLSEGMHSTQWWAE